MELERLFHFGADAAKSLFERQGHLVPMWVGISEKGAHIPLIVTDLDDKDQTADTIRAYLKKHKIIRYVSMLECWMYLGKEIPPEMAAGVSLEHNPDRREGIHIMAEDRDGKTISGRFFILRPEHGKAKLSPLKTDPEAVKSEGRFVGMFS